MKEELEETKENDISSLMLEEDGNFEDEDKDVQESEVKEIHVEN